MTAGQLIATTAVVGATVITLADAPNWKVESYLGLLGGLAGTAFISQINPAVGKGLTALLLAALLLSRGEEALSKAGGSVRRVGSSVRRS